MDSSDQLEKPRVYLDHAATRFPKPKATLDAMREYSASEEAAAGRGAYRSSQNASAIVGRLRREIASWIGAATDNEISFHSCGTTALNTAILGLLRSGDHVVTTAAEHNSVLRPLHHLADAGTIEWTVVDCDATGLVSAEEIAGAVQPNTRLVAVVHAVNVNGVVQPVAQVAEALGRCEPRPLLLCDAAQSFGHLPLNVRDLGIDILAAPGHKGGGGPLGTGFLYVNQALHPLMQPTVFGGTGTRSESLEMPTDYPSAFEPGNANVPALAGWLAGLRARRGDSTAAEILQATADRLQGIAAHLYDTLESIDGVRVIGRPADLRLPVASFAVEDFPAGELAMILDTEFNIEVRSGWHCAALVHQRIGSPSDGTVRASCDEHTSEQEIDRLGHALREVTAE